MSDLKRIELNVKNYNVKNSADIDTLYSKCGVKTVKGKPSISKKFACSTT